MEPKRVTVDIDAKLHLTINDEVMIETLRLAGEQITENTLLDLLNEWVDHEIDGAWAWADYEFDWDVPGGLEGLLRDARDLQRDGAIDTDVIPPELPGQMTLGEK